MKPIINEYVNEWSLVAEWVRAQSLAILTSENTSPERAWSLRSQWGLVKGCKWGENPCLYSNTSLALRDARRLFLKIYT